MCTLSKRDSGSLLKINPLAFPSNYHDNEELDGAVQTKLKEQK